MAASKMPVHALLTYAARCPKGPPSLSVSIPCRSKARPYVFCPRAAASSGREFEAPNLPQLCEKARLELTPEEIADFTPKISSVVDWFSQLQDVDLENVTPAVRVGEGDGDGLSTLRPDVPVVFQEREALLAALPDREGPFLKVPKILNEE